MARTINYSVALRKKPNDEMAVEKAYGQIQSKGSCDIEEISEKISRSTTMTRGDVKGVIAALEDEVIDKLLNGEIVKLGDLGTFRLSMQSTGADSMETFSTANIKGVKVIFAASARIKKELTAASFTVVAPTWANNATLAAFKAGEATVDLEAAQRDN